MSDVTSTTADRPERRRRLPWLAIVLVAIAMSLPWAANAAGMEFYIGVATRIMIFAIAASSLNLILGYGGMISFGHAAFLGVGAYAVGIAAFHGVGSAWLAWGVALACSAVAALLVGLVVIRTRGVYFIMITMAMSQLLYFFFVGLRTYGGDDGLRIVARPMLGMGIDVTSDTAFFFVVLAWLVLVHVLMAVVVRSRFGLALSAIRENEQRALAVGYNVARYRLGAFVLAGTMAGLAGALLAMHNLYVSPQLLHWSQSGTLLIMVALGGVGYFYGGILGAAALLALEELLSSNFTYFHVYTGLILLAVVLLVPDGLSSVSRWRRLRAAVR